MTAIIRRLASFSVIKIAHQLSREATQSQLKKPSGSADLLNTTYWSEFPGHRPRE